MKNCIIGTLRILGILAVCALLLAGWHLMESREVNGPMEILFPQMNDDADCAILYDGSNCVVIDTGEAQDAQHILELLQANRIHQINCLILTHPDADHVGGAAYLAQHISVRQVITPYFVGEKQVFNDLLETFDNLRIPVLTLSRDRLLTYGDMDLQIFPPEEFHYDKSNNYSLAVLVKHGEVQAFFAGDAENKRIKELLDLGLPSNVALYKTAHHGRASESGPALIDVLQPQRAVVCAEAPEQEIAEAFRRNGTLVLSNREGDLCFISDGKELTAIAG